MSEPLNVKVGDLVCWRERFRRDCLSAAKVTKVTPSGRFHAGTMVCNPDGTVRGSDSFTHKPYAVYIPTDDDIAKLRRQKMERVVAELSKNVANLTDDQLTAIYEIAKEAQA